MRRHALTTAALAVVAPLALAPLASAAVPHTGPAARPAALTLKALPASSSAGKTLTLRGNVAKGAKVLVQRKYAGGGWTTVGKDTGDRHGHYAVKVKLAKGGTTSFRAVQGKTSTKPDSLAVYQWLTIDDGSYLAEGEVLTGETVKIHKKSYADSFLSGGFGGIVVETDGQCTKADVFSGFRDADSKAGADATQDLQVAGYLDPSTPSGAAKTTSTKVGAARHVVYNVKAGTKFVSMSANVSNVDDGQSALGVIGTPRVYCNAASIPQFDPSTFTDPSGSGAA